MASLAELEEKSKAAAAARKRTLDRARKAADEKLGKELRELLADASLSRAEQVETAQRWLDDQKAKAEARRAERLRASGEHQES